VSARIKGCLRESDTVARLGGDEFVIALPSVPGNDTIEEVVQKLLAAVRDPFLIAGHKIQVSGSIGIAQYPADGDTPGALLRTADTAMYVAKAKGRGTHCFFTPELAVSTQRRILLINDLPDAYARGQFVIYCQPLVATDSGSIIGVEALLRWNHPQHGAISPVEFIPLLEEPGDGINHRGGNLGPEDSMFAKRRLAEGRSAAGANVGQCIGPPILSERPCRARQRCVTGGPDGSHMARP